MKELSKIDQERIDEASINELVKVEGTNITLWEVPDNVESREYWRDTFKKGAYYEHPIAFNEGYNKAIEEVTNILRNGRGTDISFKSWFFEEIDKLKK